MDRILIISIVLAGLAYYAQQELLQILIYTIIGIEVLILILKQVKKRIFFAKKGRV